MKNVTRLAIVDPVDSSRTSLKNLFLGIDTVWLEAECSSYEFFTDVIMQTQPDIALISLDSDPTRGLELVTEVNESLPNCSALVISSSQEGSLILQAMRNGAREFLSYPLHIEDLLDALDRIRQVTGRTAGDGEVRQSSVTTVCGVSGGVGCTSLSINLACSLAQDERNHVSVIDLDLSLGDADVWLDIIPDYTIQDVAENIARLDYSLLKRSLTKHECGAFLLPRPVEMDDRPTFTPEELRRVLALLKTSFSHLIIDVSKSYGELDVAAMEASDEVLLVTQLDLPCLRNVVRLTQFFDQREGLADKVKIVVNRVGLQDSQISLNKALETIGREVFFEIPNDYITMVESRNNGVPLLRHAPKTKVSKAIENLATLLDRDEEVEETPPDPTLSRRLFRFLGSGT